MASVTGYYSTKFGELWDRSLFSLVDESIQQALKTAHLKLEQVDAIFFGNMLGGVLGNNLHSGAKIAEILHIHKPVFRVEAACASGGMAFHLAHLAVLSGRYKNVLVVGAEKMTDYSPEEVTEALSAAASGAEQESGLTFPGLYAMLANVYMNTYGYTEEHLAHIAYKNHMHGTMNSNAQFRKKLSVEQIMKSSYVAFPLKVLDCSPISDGAAAVVISSEDKGVKILASEVATDSISLAGRAQLDSLNATKIAADAAFALSGLKRQDIQVAEVHDCFTIGEILAMEDIGFWNKGEGGKNAKKLTTMYGSDNSLIVNTSGGLKAAGHPVGATGIKQIGEVFLQLMGRAEDRQVKQARYGLAHNVGGSGGTAVVTILGNT